MTKIFALNPLAQRVGVDVSTLIEMIAASADCQDRIVQVLTLAVCLPVRGQFIIAPDRPATYPVPVELFASAKQINAHLPEKVEKFNAIVKAMGFHWHAPDWVREVGDRNGPVADRMVELGCRLLAAGFIVAVPTAEIRDRIEAGDYTPEVTRWIVAVNQGEFAGWFWVQWGRSEDFYRFASKIHGMRYDAPRVVIAPEAYDEVLDFAEKFDFRLSAGAQQLIVKAEAQRGAVTTVTPVVHDAAPVTATLARPELVPEMVGIANDLADDD